MKRFLLILIITTLPAVAIYSQSAKVQWEYLVVAKKGVPFSQPGWHSSETPSVLIEPFKLFRYGTGESVLQESVETELAIDQLGAAGWELVTIVGVIGGDQEMVFKRQVSPVVAAAEAKAAKKNIELIAKKNDAVRAEAQRIEQKKAKAKADMVKAVEALENSTGEIVDKIKRAIELAIPMAGYTDFTVSQRPASWYFDVNLKTARTDYTGDREEELKGFLSLAAKIFKSAPGSPRLTIIWEYPDGTIEESPMGYLDDLPLP